MEFFSTKSGCASEFVAEHRADPGGTLVALDFDGTLAEIVPNPEEATIHPGARRQLARLVAQAGHVVIITGRPVDQVRRLGDLDDLLDRLVVFGQYGSERLDACGLHLPPTPAGVERARAGLVEIAEKNSGVFVEDKRIAVAVHTRRAAPGTLQRISDEVLRLAADCGLRAEPGREVIELRAHRVSKGDTLRAQLAELAPRRVAMVGDDLGDLPAFEVVSEARRRGLRGVNVVSGSAERPELANLADVLCAGPAGVAGWLAELTAACF